jgi:hypothetical protein
MNLVLFQRTSSYWLSNVTTANNIVEQNGEKN